MVNSMTAKFPGPVAVTHAQTITSPPLCLTLGIKFLCCVSLLLIVELFIMVISDHLHWVWFADLSHAATEKRMEEKDTLFTFLRLIGSNNRSYLST